VTIYYDGSCRICCAQRDRFLRYDPGGDRLAFVDVADPAFDPASLNTTPTTPTTGAGHSGSRTAHHPTRESLLASIHARASTTPPTPGGQLLSGMAALRLAYTALGRGRLLSVTGWPIVKPIADALYRILARNRHRFGRVGRSACDDDTCRPKEP